MESNYQEILIDPEEDRRLMESSDGSKTDKKNNLMGSIMNDLSTCDVCLKYPKEVLNQMFFIVNRKVSASFPQQTNMLNWNGIDGRSAMMALNEMLIGNRNKKWRYVKTDKSSKKIDGGDKISSATINKYCAKYNVSKKDVDFAFKMFRDEMVEELKEFEKMLKILGE